MSYCNKKILKKFHFEGRPSTYALGTYEIFKIKLPGYESFHMGLKKFLAESMQKWLSNLRMNFALYIVKVEKKNSSENKMPLVKVVPNDPCYCSKFSFHGRNLKNESARA